MGEVFEFTVNGQVQRTEEDKPLLRYLRDDLKLYSVKDGCSEGACGTCTIVVDGKAIKSCVLTTKRAVGRNILTVEGLSDEWKDAFVYAFGAVGSVWFLYSGHGDGRNGIIAEQFKSDGRRCEIRAARKYLPLYRIQENY